MAARVGGAGSPNASRCQRPGAGRLAPRSRRGSRLHARNGRAAAHRGRRQRRGGGGTGRRPARRPACRHHAAWTRAAWRACRGRPDDAAAGAAAACGCGWRGGRGASRGLGRQFLGRRAGALFGRDGLADQLLDRPQLVAILMAAQRHRLARGAGTRGAADAVDVGFGHFRQVELDDVGDAVHIDAARGDVGRDQHRRRAVAEGGQRALARVLRLVAMDGVGRDAVLVELLHDAVGAVLGAAEHQGAADAFATSGSRPARGACPRPAR